MDSKKAFLLLAFGGADSIDDIGPFVTNVLKGRPVSDELIEKARERYRLIGGRSPLLDITTAQAKAVEAAAESQGLPYKAYVGMRYWHPFIKETISQMKEDGVTEAVALVMSPFLTRIATGGYQEDVKSIVKDLGGSPRIEFLSQWHLNARFIDLLAKRINSELSEAEKKDFLVIFSSHSLPMTALEGDPYELQINQTVVEILKKTGALDYKVSFQSRGAAPREWLGPNTEDIIADAKKKGKKGVLIVPIGFVADHVETLYDIDIFFKAVAAENGLLFKRTPSFNSDPGFTGMLADLAIRHIERKQ